MPNNLTEISFGAYQWLVLEQYQGGCLLITKDIVAYRGIGATAWDGSALRKWLNKDFLQLGFSQAEQEKILQTQVINSRDASGEPGTARNNFDLILCADTVDKVFLLNVEQALRYFPNAESRIATWHGSPEWWLLRSAVLIDYDGWMFQPDSGHAEMTFGVRPALRLPTDFVSVDKKGDFADMGDLWEQADQYEKEAHACCKRGDYEGGLQSYLAALRCFSTAEAGRTEKTNTGLSCKNVAYCYEHLGNTEQAAHYYDLARQNGYFY